MAAAFFASRLPKLGRLVHPIYVSMGIAPSGAQAATAGEGPLEGLPEMRL